MQKLYIFLIIAAVIATTITVLGLVSKDEYSLNIEYVGQIKVNSIGQNFGDGTLCYIVDERRDEHDYPLINVWWHRTIEDIENEFNVEFEIKLKRNRYYIFTYGRKIENAQILFKYDEDDSEFLYTYYYGKVEYEEGFSEDMIYIYQVDKANVEYSDVIVLDGFGEAEDIELVIVNEDSANIHVFRSGEINPIYEQNPFNRYDVTTEIKVYYYKYESPYLYVINKWGRYTVINTDTKEIAERTYDYGSLTNAHKAVYDDMDSFNDISYLDKIPKKDAIEFGDGTIYLKYTKGIYIAWNEIQRTYMIYDKSLAHDIVKYALNDNLLFLINSDGWYYIVDIQSYNLVNVSKNLADMPKEYQDILTSGIKIVDLYGWME